MSVKSIHEAKTYFSQLIEQVLKGEVITISKSGRPVAILGPIKLKKRKPGYWKGKIKISPDFDELPGDFVDEFYAGKI